MKRTKNNLLEEARSKCAPLAGQLPLKLNDEEIFDDAVRRHREPLPRCRPADHGAIDSKRKCNGDVGAGAVRRRFATAGSAATSSLADRNWALSGRGCVAATGARSRWKTTAAFNRRAPCSRPWRGSSRAKVSTRDYAGAIGEAYGVKKSSVSREWKKATEAELQRLCEREVPKDLVALIIDGKRFARECIVVALGVDLAGKKHALGLWAGSTTKQHASQRPAG